MAGDDDFGDIPLALANVRRTPIDGEPRTMEAIVVITNGGQEHFGAGRRGSHVRESQSGYPPHPNGLTITNHTGSIFDDAPDGTVLIHACNCQGVWGAGIAAQFAEIYPRADQAHVQHCRASKPAKNLLGTALLIPPMETDKSVGRHWIGCLFTSVGTGSRKSRNQSILDATASAMRDLMAEINQREGITGIRICEINSGLFAVPWEESLAVLRSIAREDDWAHTTVEVWSYPAPKPVMKRGGGKKK